MNKKTKEAIHATQVLKAWDDNELFQELEQESKPSRINRRRVEAREYAPRKKNRKFDDYND